MTTQTNIVLADDHQIVLDGLQFMLSSEKYLQVVYTSLNTNGVLQYLETSATKVQLLITDINMPTVSGIELCKKVKELYPHIKVLVLSMYSSTEIVKEAILAEADGYMLKDGGKEKLLAAIHKLNNDGTYYSEEIIPIIYNQFSIEKKAALSASNLSDREKEILVLIAKEYSSEQIAEKLFLSIKTVGNHRQNILAKCECKSSVGLVKYAIKSGLITV
ncbi:MAG: response regulator transcription factor [Bacteroidia bacterium]|nr:response regulator transcription factor [Bacteroidia bacterium]